MSPAIPTDPETSAAQTAPGSVLRVVLANGLVWGVICSLGAAGDYRDGARLGHAANFLRVWGAWLNAHVPLFVLSVALMLVLPRIQDRCLGGRAIASLYGALALLYFPLHMIYTAVPGWLARGDGQSLIGYVLQRDNFTWFLEFAWFSGTYAVVMAIHIWRLGQQRAAELQAAREANLALELALERQRLHGMRQQLEPHFIFNALNSISALVRSNEQPVALEGIASLSTLLRYALKASAQDAVCLGEEIAFCHDYLDLQQMRYGTRLQLTFDDPGPAIERVECPPLLLQPLIENALRHDLDRHTGPTQLTLQFHLDSTRLKIRVWNSLAQRGPANAGLGLGLAHARERLALMYGSRAVLATHETPSSFEVRVELPISISE
ncbi:histidine kinase [Paucibacter sp. B2R-40]|uniref:sensor histidine kinase n=1 Tax=Paucibacter sp. B2R-40 TaxID=2893554 RepID=UPI0021E4112C|nr:histidine kinase [Paucibacter sp. B2R-40]MCV2353456.1 histidine kinase [Paucibacter sp. B2R-40]